LTRPRVAIQNFQIKSAMMRRGSALSLQRLWRASQNQLLLSNVQLTRSASSHLLIGPSNADKEAATNKFRVSHGSRHFVSSPLEWWQTRQQSKQEEKYKARVLEMAEMSDWTLKGKLSRTKW
jgi:hypothetical protein